MGEQGTSYLVSQLGYHAPGLVVELGAFVLALVFVRKAAVPSVLTMAGAGLMAAAAVVAAVVQASIFDARHADPNPAGFAHSIRLVALAGSLARALGLELVVVAVFVGRSGRGRAADRRER